MTTQEIFEPLFLNALFSVFGSFAAVGASSVKKLTVNDADKACSEFQISPSKKARERFLVMFCMAPFIFGAIWGLIHAGIFTGSINEPVSYAIAMAIGVIANSIVFQLNKMNIEDLITIIKKIKP